jgi:glycosyltransferase involved in cell wall biosynthesis
MSPKTVCFLLNNDFTSDMRVARERSALIQAGYSVTLFCCKSNKPEAPKHQSDQGFWIHRIFKRRLYKYHLASFRAVKALVQVLWCHPAPFDAVHVHDANMLLLGWVLAKLWRAKLVYDSHEYWHSLFEEEAKRLEALPNPKEKAARLKQLNQTRALEEWILPQCHQIITVSRRIGDKILALAKASVPLQVVRNIPPAILASSQNGKSHSVSLHHLLNIPADTPLLLYQGQIAEKRGTGLLVADWLALLLSVPKTHPAWQWQLVLMGPVLPSDEAYVADIQKTLTDELQPHVRFLPPVPAQDILAYSASARLGIHPILNTSENHYLCLPNKLFEYVQAGIPVAVSRFPEMEAIVSEFQLGMTFDPHQPDSLRKVLQDYIEDAGAYPRLTGNVKKAQETLCWEKEQHALLSAYEHLF